MSFSGPTAWLTLPNKVDQAVPECVLAQLIYFIGQNMSPIVLFWVEVQCRTSQYVPLVQKVPTSLTAPCLLVGALGPSLTCASHGGIHGSTQSITELGESYTSMPHTSTHVCLCMKHRLVWLLAWRAHTQYHTEVLAWKLGAPGISQVLYHPIPLCWDMEASMGQHKFQHRGMRPWGFPGSYCPAPCWNLQQPMPLSEG